MSMTPFASSLFEVVGECTTSIDFVLSANYDDKFGPNVHSLLESS